MFEKVYFSIIKDKAIMNTLVKVEADDSRALATLSGLADAAKAFAVNGRSESTRKVYRRHWRCFGDWCGKHGLVALPADGATLSLYLTAQAESGLAVSTMGQGLAAIGEAHRAMGHPSPRSAPGVAEVWKGIKRSVGTAQRRVAPICVQQLRAMVGRLPDRKLSAMRDRALLVVGFAGAFRRSEIVALQLNDVEFTDDGLIITIRKSKTDQEGAGVTVGLPFGSLKSTCPVRALRNWIEKAQLEEGALFRSVDRWENVGGSLQGIDVARIVKRAAERAGLDSSKYSGHSLRAGLATSAAKAGRSDRSIMKQGRWASRTMVDRYVRDATILGDDNAAGGIGL